MRFHKNILRLDVKREVAKAAAFIKERLEASKKDGLVLGLSGGVDSAVVAALCVRSVGKERVLGLVLPEMESDPESVVLAREQAARLGIREEVVDITRALRGAGAYLSRDRAVKKIDPAYNPGDKIKITLPPDLLARDSYNFYTLTVERQSGQRASFRLTRETLRAITSATNIKQRMRMLHLYHLAEAADRLVCGTTNRTEYVLGFFVKHGDGGVDLEPCRHLYKTQVYQLAGELDILEAIVKRTPTPDTFSLSVSDEEFYFRIPYRRLDLLLYAWERRLPVRAVSVVMGLETEQVERAFRDFSAKHRLTAHLRRLPDALEPRRAQRGGRRRTAAGRREDK
jgi:NAD+ synthase